MKSGDPVKVTYKSGSYYGHLKDIRDGFNWSTNSPCTVIEVHQMGHGVNVISWTWRDDEIDSIEVIDELSCTHNAKMKYSKNYIHEANYTRTSESYSI